MILATIIFLVLKFPVLLGDLSGDKGVSSIAYVIYLLLGLCSLFCGCFFLTQHSYEKPLCFLRILLYLGARKTEFGFVGFSWVFFSSWTANCPCIELRIFENKTTESPSYFVCTFLVVFSFGDNALLLWGKMFTKWYWWLKRYLGLLDENGAINRYTCRKATKNNSDTKFCSFLHHMTLNLLDWFLWHSSKLKLM